MTFSREQCRVISHPQKLASILNKDLAVNRSSKVHADILNKGWTIICFGGGEGTGNFSQFLKGTICRTPPPKKNVLSF